MHMCRVARVMSIGMRLECGMVMCGEFFCLLLSGLLQLNLTEFVIPKLRCGFDRLDWKMARNMVEENFRYTGTEFSVCYKKTVECFFFSLLPVVRRVRIVLTNIKEKFLFGTNNSIA